MDQLAANTHFSSSLVRFGLCDQDHANQIARNAEARWLPLGRILVRQKKITIQDSAEIFSRQAEKPHMLFGEVAVELGYCTAEDVDEAIAFQRKECPHVLDLAIADSELDAEGLLAAAADYIRYTERLISQLETVARRGSV
jgi:hypothetical protein